MCVIAFSPKGVDIPTPEKITDMWYANPDGAGYAYNKGDKVIYRKGFMTLQALLDELKEPERFKNTNFAIHFRIGTSGKNDGATCHPFPISTDFGELRKTEGAVDSVLFHNGVIGTGGLINPLSSDTQDLVVAIAPLIQKYNKSKARDSYLANFTAGNRLLILYKDNAFKMYGDWKQDGDLWVSNTTYKDYGGYTTYSGRHGWEDDWYEDYYYKKQANYYDKLEREEEKEAAPIQDSDKVVAYLLGEAIKHEYVWITDNELDKLLDKADDYTVDEMFYDGYVFGYCRATGCIWLVKSPFDIDVKKGVDTPAYSC